MWYFWKGIYEVEILVLVIMYCMEENLKDKTVILRTIHEERELAALVNFTRYSKMK